MPHWASSACKFRPKLVLHNVSRARKKRTLLEKLFNVLEQCPKTEGPSEGRGGRARINMRRLQGLRPNTEQGEAEAEKMEEAARDIASANPKFAFWSCSGSWLLVGVSFWTEPFVSPPGTSLVQD